MATEKHMPVSLFVERILLVITILGLTCLCVGLSLHIIGRVFDYLTVAQVGAYILLVGIGLIVLRILSWITEKIVERGVEES